MNENVTGTRQGARRDLRSSLHPLHEAALRIADIGLNRSRARTKDLVSMLLAHGARAWRTAQPEVGIHLHVHRNGRSHPIRMRVR